MKKNEKKVLNCLKLFEIAETYITRTNEIVSKFFTESTKVKLRSGTDELRHSLTSQQVNKLTFT